MSIYFFGESDEEVTLEGDKVIKDQRHDRYRLTGSRPGSMSPPATCHRLPSEIPTSFFGRANITHEVMLVMENYVKKDSDHYQIYK